MWGSYWADTSTPNPWTAPPGTVIVPTGGGTDAERREDQ